MSMGKHNKHAQSPQAPLSRWCRFVMKKNCTFNDCIYGHLEDFYAGVLGEMPNLMLKDKKTLVACFRLAMKEVEKENKVEELAGELSNMCGRVLSAGDLSQFIDATCATLHFDINGTHDALTAIIKFLITYFYPHIPSPCPSHATAYPSFHPHFHIATGSESEEDDSHSTSSMSSQEDYSEYPTAEFVSLYYM